jgi:hypothetical protein
MFSWRSSVIPGKTLRQPFFVWNTKLKSLEYEAGMVTTTERLPLSEDASPVVQLAVSSQGKGLKKADGCPQLLAHHINQIQSETDIYQVALIKN